MKSEDLIPASEFCRHHRIEVAFIHSLHDFGLLELKQMEQDEFIDSNQLSDLEKMVRLHYELNINLEGIDAITQLMKRMEALHEEMNALRNRLRLYEDL